MPSLNAARCSKVLVVVAVACCATAQAQTGAEPPYRRPEPARIVVSDGGPTGPVFAPQVAPLAPLPALPATSASTTDIAFAAPAAGTPPEATRRAIQPRNGAAASAGYRSLHFADSLTGLGTPFMVTAENDTVFVSNTTTHNVTLYQITSGGLSLVRTYGSGLGSGAGQFNGPEQVAVVGGEIFVADYANNRVQRFNKATGTYIAQFGASGSGAGQFNNPTGVVYNPVNGLVYVADRGNNRIQAFSSAGVYQFSFGSSGSGNGQLNQPYQLAVDTKGNLYVADLANSRVVKFGPTGTFIRNLAIGASNVSGVAVDRANSVWVWYGGNVYAYDQEGIYRMYYYGSYGGASGDGFLTGAGSGAVAVTPALAFAPYDGTPAIIASDMASGSVQLFTASAQQTTHPLVQTITLPATTFLGGGAVDSNQNVYVAASSQNQIRKYDRFGNFITSWGTSGTGNGQFSFPDGIAVDDSDQVYVVDRGNHRIQKFTPTGVYVTQWGGVGSGAGQFNSPSSIATDGAWIYVTDEGNDRIQKFSLTGTYVRQWGSTGAGNGQMDGPAGIAVDRNRNQVYVAEFANSRVQQFSVFGDFIQVFGDSTSGTGQLSAPVGLATDQRGNVFVADRGNNRVVQFNDNGTYLQSFANANANALWTDGQRGQIYVGASTGTAVNRYGSPQGKLDTIGIWRPSNQTFFLRKTNTTGFADISTTVQFAASTDLPVVGDWNGDGVTTLGLYRPSTGVFYLWDRNTEVSMAAPDYTVVLGNPGDIPMAGDWNGDGRTSVGVYRPSNGILYLRNKLTTGFSDYAMVLGNPSDIGVGGDWNGDGQFSAGVYRPSATRYYLSDSDSNGIIFGDYSVLLGNAGDTPFIGNWNSSVGSGLGVYRPSTGFLYLKNELTGVFADVGIYYGSPGDVGLGGVWGPVGP